VLTEETGLCTSSEQLRVFVNVVVMLAKSVIDVLQPYHNGVCVFLGNCHVTLFSMFAVSELCLCMHCTFLLVLVLPLCH